MKKLITSISFLLFLSGITCAADFMAEIKANYLNPSDQDFKDIYGGGMMYGGEVSIRLWRDLNMWIGGSYFSKKGELSFSKEETELKIIPIGAGLKYLLPADIFNFYLGGGLNYFQYEEKTPIGNISESNLGYVGKVGGYIKMFKRLLFDLYVNYSYCKVKPQEFEVNIGGIEAGIGIGYEF